MNLQKENSTPGLTSSAGYVRFGRHCEKDSRLNWMLKDSYYWRMYTELLLRVQFADSPELKSGEVLTSARILARKARCGRTKAAKFLKKCQECGILVLQNLGKGGKRQIDDRASKYRLIRLDLEGCNPTAIGGGRNHERNNGRNEVRNRGRNDEAASPKDINLIQAEGEGGADAVADAVTGANADAVADIPKNASSEDSCKSKNAERENALACLSENLIAGWRDLYPQAMKQLELRVTEKDRTALLDTLSSYQGECYRDREVLELAFTKYLSAAKASEREYEQRMLKNQPIQEFCRTLNEWLDEAIREQAEKKRRAAAEKAERERHAAEAQARRERIEKERAEVRANPDVKTALQGVHPYFRKFFVWVALERSEYPSEEARKILAAFEWDNYQGVFKHLESLWGQWRVQAGPKHQDKVSLSDVLPDGEAWDGGNSGIRRPDSEEWRRWGDGEWETAAGEKTKGW